MKGMYKSYEQEDMEEERCTPFDPPSRLQTMPALGSNYVPRV